jgi:phosphoglycolate phosphatase
MNTAIFDLDGTLVDTRKDLMNAGNATFDELKWKVRLKDGLDDGIVIAGGRSMITYGLKTEGLPYDKNLIESIYPLLLKNYDTAIDEFSYLYTGVIEMLNLLVEKGWKIGLCTNKPEVQAHTLLTKMGIRDFFESFIGANTVGVAKPDPKPLLSAIHRVGGVVEKSVLVGDTKTDRDTAAAARVKCLLVNYGHGSLVQPMSELSPEGLANSPAEIVDTLEWLCS